MDIKTLHKSQAIYKKLVEIDDEIILIEKRAQQLANNTQKVILNLEFEPTKKENVLDSDGSLISEVEKGGYQSMYKLFLNPFETTATKTTETMNFNLSDVEALSVLGTILNIKKEYRKLMIGELTKLGFLI